MKNHSCQYKKVEFLLSNYQIQDFIGILKQLHVESLGTAHLSICVSIQKLASLNNFNFWVYFRQFFWVRQIFCLEKLGK